MNLCKVVSGLLTATILVSTASNVQAQSRRPPRTASLGELGCLEVQNAFWYQAINKDIPVGREIFRAISTTGYIQSSTFEITCRLSAPNEKPKFKTLTLALGLSDLDKKYQGATIRVSVYRDGNFYQSQTVTFGEKLLWPIDVSNARSLSLEAECIRGRTCPPLYFFEDVLE